MRGRKPKPTEIKILTGHQKSRTNYNEPKPTPGCGPIPSFVESDPMAKAEWVKLVAILDPLKLVTEADNAALTLYCTTLAQWQRQVAKIAVEGDVIETKTTVKPNPRISIANEAAKLVMRLQAEFGLTPSSRSRLVVGNTATDEIADFLAKRKPA